MVKHRNAPKSSSQSSTVRTTRTQRWRTRPSAADSVTHGTPLQLLLANAMKEQGADGHALSLQEVVDRAGTKNGRPRISKPTVSTVLRGLSVRLSEDSIAALSKALHLPPQQIRDAIEQSVQVTMDVPERMRKLSPEAWGKLLEYGDFLLQSEGKARK